MVGHRLQHMQYTRLLVWQVKWPWIEKEHRGPRVSVTHRSGNVDVDRHACHSDQYVRDQLSVQVSFLGCDRVFMLRQVVARRYDGSAGHLIEYGSSEIESV